MIFPAPGVDLQNTFQNDLPELPSEPPGSPPGGPREPQEATRAPQDDPKSRPKGRKSRPHAVSERPWRPPGANLAPKRPTGLQDAILAPSGLDFGPFGSRFWRPPKTRLGASRELWGIHFWDNVESIFDPSGAHRGFISGLPGLRSESSWSSRASQFWQDLAAKTPQHQARQGRPRPA